MSFQRRIPPNAFGMAFGLIGLSGCWLTAATAALVPHWAGTGLLALTAVVWLALLVAYCAQPGGTRTIGADLVHPVLAPFVTLMAITPMRLAALGLRPYAPSAGRVVVDALVVVLVLHGCWFTGQLIYGDYPLHQIHPGYFLPTVAGGLLAATSAAEVGQRGLGLALFGYGVLCWIILGSIILGRLITGPPLPQALQPTLAIEVAPAAVATTAWLSLHDGRIDVVTQLLAGYGVLMVLAQLRLVPLFRRLPFQLGFWSFTFSWAAVAIAAQQWLQGTRPPGYVAWEWLALVSATVLIGGIGIRTVVALVRKQLFATPQHLPHPDEKDQPWTASTLPSASARALPTSPPAST
ncbi:hypothetical protein [Angustibacter sp. Root456]|uniref:SLAC1 family transporter n=1 Tax=Angustibacter sp. Root456 TaxID=1736539 RepID=UPI0009EB17FF|nr:hypothetical protein [Angustibacter sp. Root456]